MSDIVVVLVLLSLSSYVTLTFSIGVRLPIGAFFDHEFHDIYRAFHFRVDEYNRLNATTEIRLDKYETVVDVNNSFELNRAICSVLGKGVLAMVGTTDPVAQPMVESMARSFRIPYITLSSSGLWSVSSASLSAFSKPVTFGWTTTPVEYTIYMRPTIQRAVFDVLNFYGWKRLVYLCDSNDGIARFQELVSIRDSQNLNITMAVANIALSVNSHKKLRTLDSQHPTGTQSRNYVLDFSTTSHQQTAIRQILSLGMHRSGYHYIVVSMNLNELDINRFSYGGAILTGFRLVPTRSLQKNYPPAEKDMRKLWRISEDFQNLSEKNYSLPLSVALTMDAVSVVFHGLRSMSNKEQSILRQIFGRHESHRDREPKPSKCGQLVSIGWSFGSTIFKHLRLVNFVGETGVVSFDKNGHRQNVQLDVLQTRLEEPLLKIGEWHSVHGLRLPNINITEKNSFKRTESNVTRTIVSLLSPPYLMIRKRRDSGSVVGVGGDRRYEGFCDDLAELVAVSVGFNYSIRLSRDGKYGIQLANGSWNGIIGELMRQEADLAIAPLTITSERERLVDFTIPYMSLGISIMIKRPDKLKPGVFSFLNPLSLGIWVCIVVAYLVVSFVLFLVSRMNSVEWGHVTEKSQVRSSISFANNFTFQNSLWFALGGFMRQGCDISPRSFGGRVAGSSWWFFTLIIISSYTANLAAFLTVERMVTPIESADDLAKQTEVLYGTLDSGSTKEFFQTSRVKTYQRMWSFMKLMESNGVFVPSTEFGVAKVRNSKGKYAFLLESTMNEYYNQRKPCNTIRVGQLFDYKGYGIATPIGSDLRDSVGLAVLKLMEDGELKKLQKKWWYDKGECPTESDAKTSSSSSQSALTLSNVAGIFYILIAGLSLAIIVSILQYFCVSNIDAKRNKRVTIAAYRRLRFQPCGPLANDDAFQYTQNDRQCIGDSRKHQVQTQTLPAIRSSVISLV